MKKAFTIHALPGRTVRLDGPRDYLWFSGTDYLGMGHNGAFQQYLREGLERYGTHFGSSRNNSLRLAVYEEAEAALADFAGTSSALTVSSGMWAGQLVMKYLESRYPDGTTLPHPDAKSCVSTTTYHYAPCVHPALWGTGYAATTTTWTEWAYLTVQAIEHSTADQLHIICTDSVGSPWVEVLDFSVFGQLPTDKQVWLVVDDSHGLGVLGEQGRGIFSQLPRLANVHTLVVASLNKALGIPAGVIMAEENVVQEIRSLPWFAGSSPSAPAYMYALTQLLQSGEYPRAHEVLLSNSRYFTEKITPDSFFIQYPDYPVYCSRNIALYEHLHAHGILAACFPYPRPTDEPVMRLVISTLHQKEDLDRLAEVCNTFSS
ncbi:aminotransferase class I/II-fold pyridoxal phosphate-dependent enzyme [Telluribacter sp.]|jgi:7-keto-8-aminopelargonate synthetase-like enzyme|uniref:aminotransferase class I/II-fold pyridoxal phosphate-dependent enzyme n=1 Tax=Telluribacter sp. TaxID=1978767 RepID=UPI002E0F7B4F|nr:aminotransferase class I/II-fold pyridoxal phosphate-dependent enzyme [Telluribacter sp.]